MGANALLSVHVAGVFVTTLNDRFEVWAAFEDATTV